MWDDGKGMTIESEGGHTRLGGELLSNYLCFLDVDLETNGAVDGGDHIQRML